MQAEGGVSDPGIHCKDPAHVRIHDGTGYTANYRARGDEISLDECN